jgi:hypothetical protein
MNKRIEKLADQCQLYDGWFTQQGKIEKFAQLIVLECANYASRNWEHGHLLAQDLKNHFGVEK